MRRDIALGLGIGATALAASAAISRRGFFGRADSLRRTIEAAPNPGPSRTDVPPEVAGLGRRMGVPETGAGRLVRLTQRGQMWMQPEAKPLTFTARQTIAVTEIGSLWEATFALPLGASMCVIDFVAGEMAGLEGRLLGCVPVVRVDSSDDTYRGEAMRYLGELIWNPDALLFNPYLEWGATGPGTLALATGAGKRRCEVVLHLDAGGNLTTVRADARPRVVGRQSVDTPWFGRVLEHCWIHGRSIPLQAEVGWIIDGAEFVYFRCRIESWSVEG